ATTMVERRPRIVAPTARVGRSLLLAIVLASVPSLARADAPEEKPAITDADSVFKSGLERYDAGDVAGAVRIWDRLVVTLGEKRAWKALYNLGRAHQDLGDVDHAVQALEAFLRQVQEQPEAVQQTVETQRHDAEARLTAIKASYGVLEVR